MFREITFNNGNVDKMLLEHLFICIYFVLARNVQKFCFTFIHKGCI